MWTIKLKNDNIYQKVIKIIAPDLDSEDQRNIYVTENGQYYPEDIADVRF